MPNQLDYAIVIGVEYYKGIDPLGGPHSDVDDFIDWLKSKSGGDVPEINIGSFISTPTFSPSQENIDDWITGVLDTLQNNGTRGRRIYFYFSGHGIGDKAENSALLLPKWSFSMRNYALSSEKYLEEFLAKGLFEEIYFFMDCCRNRVSGVKGQAPYWAAAMPSSNSTEYFLHYSTEFDNLSYEASVNTLDNSLTRGLFTKVLLDGLRGAAADRNGKLCVPDLVRYVKKKLPELAISKGTNQVPRDKRSIDDQKQITNPFSAFVDFTFKFKTPGINVILEDPELNEVKKGNSSDINWNLKLRRGEYILRKEHESSGVMIYIDGLENSFVYD